MPTEKTPDKIIQDAIVAILQDGATALKVDGRTVRVVRGIPKQRFTVKGYPAIFVGDPSLVGEKPWGAKHDRRDYAVEFAMVDQCRANAEADALARERLGLLHEKMRALFETERNLRLAFLHVFYSQCAWDTLHDIGVEGANRRAMAARLEVPITLERGKIWST